MQVIQFLFWGATGQDVHTTFFRSLNYSQSGLTDWYYSCSVNDGILEWNINGSSLSYDNTTFDPVMNQTFPDNAAYVQFASIRLSNQTNSQIDSILVVRAQQKPTNISCNNIDSNANSARQNCRQTMDSDEDISLYYPEEAYSIRNLKVQIIVCSSENSVTQVWTENGIFLDNFNGQHVAGTSGSQDHRNYKFVILNKQNNSFETLLLYAYSDTSDVANNITCKTQGSPSYKVSWFHSECLSVETEMTTQATTINDLTKGMRILNVLLIIFT